MNLVPPIRTYIDASNAHDVKLIVGCFADDATIRDTAGELWSKISSLRGVFLVTDPRGRVVTSLGGVTTPSLGRNLDLVQDAAPRFPEQSSGFYLTGHDLYHFAITPVVQPNVNCVLDSLRSPWSFQTAARGIATVRPSVSAGHATCQAPASLDHCSSV